MPKFESFNRAMLSLRGDPQLTIQKRGTICVNRSAFTALGAPEAVELLFDPERQIVGLRAVDPKAADAYFVRQTSRSPSGPWVISAMAFTHYYDIDTSVSLRWTAYLEDAILCAEIGKAGIPVSGNRAYVQATSAHAAAECLRA